MAAGERVLDRIDPKRGAKMGKQQADLIAAGGTPVDQGAGKLSEAADGQKQAAGELREAAADLRTMAGSLRAALGVLDQLPPPWSRRPPVRKQGGVHRRDEAGY